MQEIKDFRLLNAVSGGFERYMSKAEIVLECSKGTISMGIVLGLVGCVLTIPLGTPIAIAGGIAGAVAGLHLGYHIDQYCSLEPGVYNIVYS